MFLSWFTVRWHSNVGLTKSELFILKSVLAACLGLNRLTCVVFMLNLESSSLELLDFLMYV